MLAAFAVSAGTASLCAQDFLTLKGRLYDRHYGDFGGEFDANRVSGCTFDVNQWSTGMVQKTLGYDSVLNKKIPRKGANDVCSENLEKWFDPGQSRKNACVNLFLHNVAPMGQPVWKFQDSVFFPMNPFSDEIPWRNSQGVTLSDDFAYCMEINAGMIYRGGETIKFQGDDDLWVYIDGQLAFDMGGVHFGMESTVNADTLPMLQGKRGQTLDLDVFFCSRQPSTAIFGLETNVELKPVPLQRLQIVDTLGRSVTSKDIIVGKTKLCARPYYQIPGDAECGNYDVPDGLSFLSAQWDLNGLPLSDLGGQECLELDPADFPDNTRLNLTAKSGRLSSKVAITLVKTASPLEGWLRGDGKWESLELHLDSSGGQAPLGLEVDYAWNDQPRQIMVYPRAGSTGFPAAQKLWGTMLPGFQGEFGHTHFPPLPAVTRQQVFGQTVVKSVILKDGIPPVLSQARLSWGNADGAAPAGGSETCGGFPAYLDLTASEGLASPALGYGMFILKFRDGLEMDLASQGAQCVIRRDEQRKVLIPEALAARFAAGDSVSLGRNAIDSMGNAPLRHFVALDIPHTYTGAPGKAGLLENPVQTKTYSPPAARSQLIAITPDKQAIANREPALSLVRANGPVLIIPTLAPLEFIRLHIFDHLGGLVQNIGYTFSEADWEGFRASASGDTVWVRLMWYPLSETGRKLGTGVYIIQGEGRTLEGGLVRVGGQTLRAQSAPFRIEPLRVGLIRAD